MPSTPGPSPRAGNGSWLSQNGSARRRRVGGEQVHEVRGPRAREADDDQRLLDLDVADLGMQAQQLGQARADSRGAGRRAAVE